MSVDVDGGEATLDGKVIPLDHTYLLILDALLQRPNSPVSSTDMGEIHSELSAEPRLDRIMKKMKREVPAIGELISSSSRGYKINV